MYRALDKSRDSVAAGGSSALVRAVGVVDAATNGPIPSSSVTNQGL